MSSSSSTCRCLARLPSVSAQSRFNSTKLSPFGWVISEVSTLSRARSWITRLRPSYAKGAAALDFFVIGLCLLLGKVMDSRNHRHAQAIRNRHRCRRQSARISHRNADQSGEQKPSARQIHRTRQASARSEHPECEHNLPQPGQHPYHARRCMKQHKRKNRPRNRRGKKLCHCHPDHLVRHTGMQAVGARQHLHRDQPRRKNAGRQPQRHILRWMICWIGNPIRLRRSCRQGRHCRPKERERPVPAKLRRLRHLPADRADIDKCLVEIAHRATMLCIAKLRGEWSRVKHVHYFAWPSSWLAPLRAVDHHHIGPALSPPPASSTTALESRSWRLVRPERRASDVLPISAFRINALLSSTLDRPAIL